MTAPLAPQTLRWGFPNPVNETSARLVAAGVVAQGVAFLTFRSGWILVPLLFGFVARVIAGPRFSPLARLVTEVITPRIGGQHHFVAGQPKRFAQGVGVAFSLGAAVAWLAGGGELAIVLVAGLTLAALFEAVFAFCLGCVVFGQLMRLGIIPESVCVECSNISARLAERVPAGI